MKKLLAISFLFLGLSVSIPAFAFCGGGCGSCCGYTYDGCCYYPEGQEALIFYPVWGWGCNYCF